ncbi:MAG: hypothetical protein LBL55_00120 [Propionibacteriaceae bacterium]|jgi:hypothetical protein|nr:hypothetical protein [Propionibacteriaceae bacterium]
MTRDHTPRGGALKRIVGAAIITPPAVLAAAYGVMHLATELYSKKVWATPEEQEMTLPGDDLVIDPYGEKLLRLTQAADLDAPLDEVWKHIYQMDPTKAGMYSWSNFERALGMNVDNTYSLEEMWQGPDALKPGDFWAWSYAAFGAEVADVVPGKYIVWFADSANPTRTPGASFMLAPGLEHCSWNWTIALKPLNGGQRCRIIARYNIAYGPHTFLNFTVQKLLIIQGGGVMTRRMFENLEKSARCERRKSLPLRLMQRALGRSHGDDPRLQARIAYPELRWSRDCPRVESVRAAFTDDPNWPPQPGQDYLPPIAENNARNGWTAETGADNDRRADHKQAALLAQLNLD